MSEREGDVKLSILGAGSVRCAPAIIGSLATYFGERPLEIRFWDADAERLDLFDRFARLCFKLNKCTHRLISTEDADEALSEADRVVLAVGENCARKYLKRNTGEGSRLVQTAATRLISHISSDTPLLNLTGAAPKLLGLSVRHTDWPPSPTAEERMGIPHQVLRFLHGDEYPHAFLAAYEHSPLKDWLNGN